MQYDLTQVRLFIQSYRRRFNAEYEKVYGASFDSYVTGTKLYVKKIASRPEGRKEVERTLRELQYRVRYIKSLIENEDKTISPAAV